MMKIFYKKENKKLLEVDQKKRTKNVACYATIKYVESQQEKELRINDEKRATDVLTCVFGGWCR